VEIATVTVGASLVIAGLRSWELAAYAWWAAFALVLSVIDIVVHRLPDRLVLACATGFFLLLAPMAFTGHQDAWLRAVTAGCAFALVLGLAAVLPGTGLGLGDAKFASAAGAAAGWVSWFAVVAVAFVSFVALAVLGLVLIAVRRARWSSHLAYGPFLAGATVVVIVALAV